MLSSPPSSSQPSSSLLFPTYSSFFGNFGFNFGGDGGDGHREIPRGGTLTLDFEVSLEDLYIGSFIELARYKAVPKPASGTRKCNCRTEMRTISMGPGRFQVNGVVWGVVYKQTEFCFDSKQILPSSKLLQYFFYDFFLSGGITQCFI